MLVTSKVHAIERWKQIIYSKFSRWNENHIPENPIELKSQREDTIKIREIRNLYPEGARKNSKNFRNDHWSGHEFGLMDDPPSSLPVLVLFQKSGLEAEEVALLLTKIWVHDSNVLCTGTKSFCSWNCDDWVFKDGKFSPGNCSTFAPPAVPPSSWPPGTSPIFNGCIDKNEPPE